MSAWLFFFNDTATTQIYTLALHDALPIFVWQAVRLWRVGTSEAGSTAGAIRLYRYSITYLTLLFVAVAVDALVAIPL